MLKDHEKLNVTFTYRDRPIIDFLHALYLYGNLEEGIEILKGRGMVLDQEVLEMMDHIDQQLSAFVKHEITTLSYLGIVDFLLIAFVSDYEELETVDHYLILVKKVPIEKLFEYFGGLFLCSYFSGPNDEWETVKHSISKMKQYIEELQGIDPTLQNEVVELFEQPEETKMRVLYAIEQFYKKGYKPFEKHVIEKSQQIKERYMSLLLDNKKQFIEVNLTHASLNGTGPLMYEQYDLYVSYMQQFGYTILANNRLEKANGTISIGCNNIKFHQSKSINANFDKFLKVIADPTRFKIITYVGKKNWYVQALAKELQLTPATIHYHLETLHALDIVTTYKEGNKVMYELNQKVTKQYLVYLNDQIFS